MRLLNAVKRALKACAPLIFVPRCASCMQVLPSTDMPLCERCMQAYLTESKKLCKGCGRMHRYCVCRISFGERRFPLVHITGYDMKRSSVSKNMILNLKDDRFDNAFDFLALCMYTTLRERYIRLFERGTVVITYVPRSSKARRKAGHDQSEEIAKRISALSGAPFVPLFCNNSSSLQKKLGKAERMQNALDSYALINPELRLTGRIVIIIDDIVTTGSSIGACATLAVRNGARAVIPLVCARTQSQKSVHGSYDDTVSDDEADEGE